MAWEQRQGSRRRYYYGSRTVGGRTVKEYLGHAGDLVASFLARQDRLAQAQQAAEREARRAEREAYAQAESRLLDYQEQASTAVRADLLARGYRWTRRRGWRLPQGDTPTMPAGPLPHAFPLPTRDDFEELVERAEDGAPQALQELRALLAAHPELWRPIGDLGEQVRAMLLDRLAGQSVVAREAIQLQLENMRREQGYDSAAPLERLLIEQVLLTWLDVRLQQIAHSEPRVNRRDAKHWEGRLQAAQRRHLAAVEGLAKLRKLFAAGN